MYNHKITIQRDSTPAPKTTIYVRPQADQHRLEVIQQKTDENDSPPQPTILFLNREGGARMFNAKDGRASVSEKDSFEGQGSEQVEKGSRGDIFSNVGDTKLDITGQTDILGQSVVGSASSPINVIYSASSDGTNEESGVSSIGAISSQITGETLPEDEKPDNISSSVLSNGTSGTRDGNNEIRETITGERTSGSGSVLISTSYSSATASEDQDGNQYTVSIGRISSPESVSSTKTSQQDQISSDPSSTIGPSFPENDQVNPKIIGVNDNPTSSDIASVVSSVRSASYYQIPYSRYAEGPYAYVPSSFYPKSATDETYKVGISAFPSTFDTDSYAPSHAYTFPVEQQYENGQVEEQTASSFGNIQVQQSNPTTSDIKASSPVASGALTSNAEIYSANSNATFQPNEYSSKSTVSYSVGQAENSPVVELSAFYDQTNDTSGRSTTQKNKASRRQGRRKQHQQQKGSRTDGKQQPNIDLNGNATSSAFFQMDNTEMMHFSVRHPY